MNTNPVHDEFWHKHIATFHFNWFGIWPALSELAGTVYECAGGFRKRKYSRNELHRSKSTSTGPHSSSVNRNLCNRHAYMWEHSPVCLSGTFSYWFSILVSLQLSICVCTHSGVCICSFLGAKERTLGARPHSLFLIAFFRFVLGPFANQLNPCFEMRAFQTTPMFWN